jgi:CheY-like chemotaxis protein
MITSKSKILIAVEDKNIAARIKDFLIAEGYEVTSVVHSGIEVITKAEYDNPDLILMDVHLNSSLNGVEAAEIILYKRNIPIIFLTSTENLSLLKKYDKAASNEFVLKPIDFYVLLNTIEKNLVGLSYQTKYFNFHLSSPMTF